jgi:hypothetical protein
MVAYLKRTEETEQPEQPTGRRNALSHDLLHGMTPEQFDSEAADLSGIQGMSGAMRERLHAQLTERLKTPVDKPSWGPDWVRHGDRNAPRHKGKGGWLSRLFGRPKDDEDEKPQALSAEEQDDAHVIARNMEKGRQVWGYRNLYILGALIAIAIALLAMFVDYQIIRGDVWTRALSNEFMVVPASLQSSLIFKSMQVIFAVLIVHFMLKITGVYGRNALISTAFVFALVMICCLGYLVAYNNMAGGTSTTLEHTGDAAQTDTGGSGNSIDQLLGTSSARSSGLQSASETRIAPAGDTKEVSFSIPKISQLSLANADSWFWLAFASVIFFIVTTVAALYIQTFENNVRNFLIARDYKHRQRQFAQLHLIDLADKRSA